jgi:hypothetical protein
MKELEESNYFNIVQFSQLQLALANPRSEEIQDLSYFEIVSLLLGFQISLYDFFLKHGADDWPDELHVDIHGLREIGTSLDECLDSFRINVWHSDLHFFFAYFRGELFS